MLDFIDHEPFRAMEQYQNLPFLPIFLLITCLTFLIRKWKKSKTSNQNFPPGPWKLPLIGNMHQLGGDLPHRRFADLAKEYGPVMHLQLGELSNIVISSPEAAKQVMKTYDLVFAYRPFLLASSIISNNSSVVFAPYGEYWRQMRRIFILELLSQKRVKSYQSIREEEVTNLITSIASSSGSVINLTKLLFASTNRIVSRAAFGKICRNEEAFVPLVKELTEVGAGLSIADLFPSVKMLQMISGMRYKLERLQKEVDEIFQKIISERKAQNAKEMAGVESKTSDLLDVLLHLQEHGDLEFPLTIDNIKGVILDIFVAGTETSTTTVEWAMSELLRNPRVMEKVQAEVRQAYCEKGFVDQNSLDELNYLKSVIKETLRLHPPVPLLIPRECQEKCVIDGYEIPAKTKVHVNVWLIGRDPSYWEEPERFWPERFYANSIDYKGANFEFIPFGAGRRICPGMSFGMANVEIPLANLLYHFDWKLPNGIKPEKLDMDEAFGASTRRKNHLYLIPTPYI